MYRSLEYYYVGSRNAHKTTGTLICVCVLAQAKPTIQHGDKHYLLPIVNLEIEQL
jgi:hypothetical protein